jgi:hypothetical protein
MSTPVWEDTPPAVEFVEMDCAVTVCDGFTIGHVSPVTGLNEAGQLVQVELQFCPRHSRVFEALMSGFRGDGGVRQSDPERRHGYTIAVEGLVSA